MSIQELINQRNFDQVIERLREGLIQNPNHQDLLMVLIDLPFDEHFKNKNLATRFLDIINELEERNILNDKEIEWVLVEGKTLLKNNSDHRHFEYELDYLSIYIDKYPDNTQAILHYIERCSENDTFPSSLNPEDYISPKNKLDSKFIARLYFSFAKNGIRAETSNSVEKKWNIVKEYLHKALMADKVEMLLMFENAMSINYVDNLLLVLDETEILKLKQVFESLTQ